MIRSPISRFAYIRSRRRDLSRELDIWREFRTWEETCVPSYCHRNWMAALVSWQRLFKAVELAKKFGRPGVMLDFGASVGELGRLVEGIGDYHFIEQQNAPADYLQKALPNAVRQTLETAPDRHYAAVFALDSLEHNENYEELLRFLSEKLTIDGVLILSGPTENMLYRAGRRIARFDAHYHVTSISAIELAASKQLDLQARRTIPFGVPLFRLSVWMRTGKGALS